MSWQLDKFRSKDVVFVGKGKGRAAAGIKEFLNKYAKLQSFTEVDKAAGNKPLEFLLEYDQEQTIFIKNEGVPGDEMPVSYITPIQIFFELIEQTDATTVGITGTKGKSTTAALTAHILRAAGKQIVLAGNIGISPFEGLDKANEQTIFVLELSSYQLSDLKTNPHVSVCLNLYNDHTDWHGSLENYWEAKHNIVRFAKKDDIFIYNPNFSVLTKWAKSANCQTLAINSNEKLDLSNANLFGEHNSLNALFAREIARQFSVDDETVQKAVETFRPLKHRMEVVAEKNNLIFIDDAIGMTPESTIASIKAITAKFGQIGCLLLGGQDRDYDFSNLMRLIADYNVANLVLFPDTVSKMKAVLPNDYNPNILETSSMSQAVKWASSNAPKNSIVLLSTAAPSYSLWQDFEDKGEQFMTAINQMI